MKVPPKEIWSDGKRDYYAGQEAPKTAKVKLGKKKESKK